MEVDLFKLSKFIFLSNIIFFALCTSIFATTLDTLHALQKAYPAHIDYVTSRYIAWKDGTRTAIVSSSTLGNWFAKVVYRLDIDHGINEKDIAHHIYEPVFKKIYGDTAKQVKSNLTTMYWMPHVFGKRYQLKVTKINGVDEKLRSVSDELEKLPVNYYKYLDNPAANFYWRKVAGQDYLSLHSFGIAIDINVKHSNYWLWDFFKLKKPISALRDHKIIYQNKIPKKIVEIFAKHGFYWGGHWYFYDTMHFEYRPELLMTGKK